MEAVFRAVERGDGYVAVEKSSLVVRNLKRQGKIDDAMFFLMNLANKLADANLWESATVSAFRAIDLFPEDARTIKVALKKEFFEFAKRVETPVAATHEFYSYIDQLSEKIGDLDNVLFMKKVEMAILAKQYFNVQLFILDGILSVIDMDEPPFDV